MTKESKISSKNSSNLGWLLEILSEALKKSAKRSDLDFWFGVHTNDGEEELGFLVVGFEDGKIHVKSIVHCPWSLVDSGKGLAKNERPP